ncbi:uroplakin-3b-like protein 1 isoform X4 [Neofelis nebulosa]|uniref:uroplakin-3b-like protein 1 isoform X4 n=1 Tax=Neofelis nebulosa TaxID=61452 RepID=UPI00272D8A00|nr:uroplakin-3b-like protein 1 isoform X4 [Neofelis nebulosa]XP_058567739.1 uroplakin-3b-like protein 1 isoform X4 [Neofelis nebulosa]XP_058567740.1 uroplakin-3b-like protein 1 isoform X4 [Neofelis nebulosa]
MPFKERISYVPQLSSPTLAGTLTQSTFTLEQPRGQFSRLNISDLDTIWLVVAHSNATQNFAAPQRVEDIPVPADFSQRGYYLTLMANRLLYPGNQPGNQLRVLRVGNDTRCSPKTRGCNHPLTGPGPYRVKFLVMSDRGPVAETEWSSETRLQQAKALQAVPGPQSAGTVVIIAILSVLLAVLFTALLALLIYTCHDTCRSAPISGPEQSTCVRRYNTHHVTGSPAVGASRGVRTCPSASSLVQAADPGLGACPEASGALEESVSK